MKLLALAMVLAITACVVEHTPDTPSNAAIQLMGAFQQLDKEVVRSLMCDAATASEIDFEMPETLGTLSDLFLAQEARGVAGGESEYTPTEEVELAVDSAWTEIEVGSGSSAETWRLHMVREDQWTACDAEKVG